MDPTRTADPRTWRHPQNDHRGRRCRRGEHPLSDLIAPARVDRGPSSSTGRVRHPRVLLVQEEFALRMLGRHPMDRGPLSLNIALQWDLELDMKVGSGSFLPAPRVRSRLVHLRAHDRPTRVSAAFLRGLVRQAFAHRRRKLGTTLRTRPTGLEDAGLRSVDWSDVIRRWRSEHVELADRRPEDLDLNGWEQVALSIHAVAGIEPSHPTKPSQ